MLGGEWDGVPRLFKGAATLEAIRGYRANAAIMVPVLLIWFLV